MITHFMRSPLTKAVMLSIFVIASCKDESETIQKAPYNPYSVEVKEGILNFKTVDAYVNLVDNKDNEVKKLFVKFVGNESKYVSLRKNYDKLVYDKGGRQMTTQEQEIAESMIFYRLF